MFLYKTVYLIFASVCIFFVLWCYIDSIIKRTKVSLAVSRINQAAFACIVPFLAAVFCKNQSTSDFFYGLYFGGLDFSNFMFLLFIYVIESDDRFLQKEETKLVSICFKIFGGFDFVLLALNCVTHWFYDLIPVYSSQNFVMWKPEFKPLFYIHLLFCLVMASYNVIRLLIDARFVTTFYKKKFYYSLFFYLTVLLVHILFLFKKDLFLFDISLPLYCIFTIVVYDFSLYFMPRTIQKNLLSIASKSISDAVFCFDLFENCIYMNNSAQKIYEDSNQNFNWVEKEGLFKKNSYHKTITLTQNSEVHIYDTEFKKIYDERGKYSGSYIKLSDRTTDIQSLESYQYRSTHDELTGLYNRSFFFREVERVIKKDPETPRYLISTNIKNFKLINDLFGPQLGDKILRKQAEMLSYASYTDTVLGRISGDKFGMLIRKDKFNLEAALTNTKRITELMKDVNYTICMHLGLYEIANPFENAITMFDKASLAMKNIADEKQILGIYDASLMERLISEKNIISEFKQAIKEDAFCMFLQPQVDSKTGRCIGSEALVRWKNAENGFRHPTEFIPVLENSGLIFELDQFIWEKAAWQLGEWKKQGKEDYYISVNISVKDFYFGDLYAIFTGLVKKYDISPSKLNLEITESAIMRDKEFHKQILINLHNFGFGIEMDDFGSGYSSLNVLKEMQMDVLKIDMEFLNKSENESRSKTVIASIIKMAKALGMIVISEGVETQVQVDFLKNAGTDIFQGYFYSKPLSVKDFEKKYMEAKK